MRRVFSQNFRSHFDQLVSDEEPAGNNMVDLLKDN